MTKISIFGPNFNFRPKIKNGVSPSKLCVVFFRQYILAKRLKSELFSLGRFRHSMVNFELKFFAILKYSSGAERFPNLELFGKYQDLIFELFPHFLCIERSQPCQRNRRINLRNFGSRNFCSIFWSKIKFCQKLIYLSKIYFFVKNIFVGQTYCIWSKIHFLVKNRFGQNFIFSSQIYFFVKSLFFRENFIFSSKLYFFVTNLFFRQNFIFSSKLYFFVTNLFFRQNFIFSSQIYFFVKTLFFRQNFIFSSK